MLIHISKRSMSQAKAFVQRLQWSDPRLWGALFIMIATIILGTLFFFYPFLSCT